MNKELAKTLTLALVNYIDENRPEETMCCSNTECESIEQMLEGEHFDIVEAFIQKKLSGLTEFEQAFIERVFHQKVEDLDEENKEIFREDARIVLALAREQLIKDGYIIEKKAFHDAVKKVSPEVMKEVSDNVDNTEEPTEFEKFMDEVVDDNIREIYSKDGFYDICRDALALAKKELLKEWNENMIDEYNRGKKDGLTIGYNKAMKEYNESVAYHFPIMPTPSTPGWGCDGTFCTNPLRDCINCPGRTTDRINTALNTASGTSTATLHGNTSATDGKEHNPSFTD